VHPPLEPNRDEQFARLSLERRAARPRQARDHHVLQRREAGQEVRVLEDDAHRFGPVAVERALAHRRELVPHHTHLARVRPVEARQQVDERGLPRPRGPDDSPHGARGDRQLDIGER
jgi:hypothetical protein